MGVRAGLYELTARAVEDAMAGGSPDISGGEYHSLDKAWVEIHQALQGAGHPLDKAISGDCLLPGEPTRFEDFMRGDRDYYVGLMSVPLVRELADALAGCNQPDEGQEAEESGFSYAGYVGWYFRELQKTYRDAASRGSGLMIVIS